MPRWGHSQELRENPQNERPNLEGMRRFAHREKRIGRTR